MHETACSVFSSDSGRKFFQQFYNFVDSVIVGKGIGDAALAAVGNTSSVHFFILGFMIGLTGGLGIYISQSFGAQDYGK